MKVRERPALKGHRGSSFPELIAAAVCPIDNAPPVLTLRMPQRGGGNVPLYDASDDVVGLPGWTKYLRGSTVVIMDAAVADLVPTKRLLAMMRLASGIEAPVLCINSIECRKTMSEVEGVLAFCASHLKDENSTIICVGGGVLINLAGFAASVFMRGRVPAIYVPTTVTALADVAIGNKTGINGPAPDGTLRKHAFGTYFEPAAIVADSAFLRRDDPDDIIEGCAEVVKHGIVQDADMLLSVGNLMRSANMTEGELFQLALRTAALKQRVLEIDFMESGIGRILQYGHLHAHSLERASGLKFSHNLAVWCGLYIDLRLGSNLANRQIGAALALVEEQVSRLKDRICLPPLKALRAAYNAESKLEPLVGVDRYSIVSLPSIGHYADPGHEKLRTSEVSWAQIEAVWIELASIVVPSRRCTAR